MKCQAPPFHYPLNIYDINVLHELSKLIKTHLSAFGPTITIVLGEILTRKNSGGMKQSKHFILPYLKKEGGEKEKKKKA